MRTFLGWFPLTWNDFHRKIFFPFTDNTFLSLEIIYFHSKWFRFTDNHFLLQTIIFFHRNFFFFTGIFSYHRKVFPLQEIIFLCNNNFPLQQFISIYRKSFLLTYNHFLSTVHDCLHNLYYTWFWTIISLEFKDFVSS